MDIYINRSGSQYGPYQQSDVERMLTDGQLLESDSAWCESMDDWAPLSSLISRPAQAQTESALMPDSVAAVAGAAVAFALLRPHYSKAHHVDSQPTNAAPIEYAYTESELPIEDGAQPPPLPVQPPPLPPEAFEPPVIEADAGDFGAADPMFAADMIEPDIVPDVDLDFDMPDIDFDFDF